MARTELEGSRAMMGYQQMRTDREKELPEYVLNMLDLARQGYGLNGRTLTREERNNILSFYLGEDN